MELITRIRHRVGYVWAWRLRYWYLDTPHGARARFMLLVFALLWFVIDTIEQFIARQRPGPHPQQGLIWMVVWLIVAVLAATAIALSAGTKAPAAQDAGTKAPTTQDGRAAGRHYGENWVEDPAQLAWKVVGKDPIKSDGGGK